MKRKSGLIVFLMVATMLQAQDTVANQEAQDFVRASLLVMAPGDQLYSIVGHSCLRMQCETYGLDYCFSYESEPVPHRVGRFLAGKLKMGMMAIPTDTFLALYQKDQRGVWEYELNLPLEVKRKLWQVLDERVMEGTNLPYDYLEHGCALACMQCLTEALDTIKMEYGPWSNELLYTTRRERCYANSPKSWNLLCCMTLVGQKADQKVSPEQNLIIPHELAEVWAQAKVMGQPLLQAPKELFPNTERSTCPITPIWVSTMLLLLAIGSLFWDKTYIDTLILILQTALGVLMVYLVLFSNLPNTTWSWLLIPFNPLFAIFWHWRSKWGIYGGLILLLWCGAMLISPHRLVCDTHILWAMSMAIVLSKDKVQKWMN